MRMIHKRFVGTPLLIGCRDNHTHYGVSHLTNHFQGGSNVGVVGHDNNLIDFT